MQSNVIQKKIKGIKIKLLLNFKKKFIGFAPVFKKVHYCMAIKLHYAFGANINFSISSFKLKYVSKF